MTPNFDDFFEYSIGVTPEENVGFNYVHIETKRKEDVNILLEFLIGKDFRRNKHSVSRIVADCQRPTTEVAGLRLGTAEVITARTYVRVSLQSAA